MPLPYYKQRIFRRITRTLSEEYSRYAEPSQFRNPVAVQAMKNAIEGVANNLADQLVDLEPTLDRDKFIEQALRVRNDLA